MKFFLFCFLSLCFNFCDQTHAIECGKTSIPPNVRVVGGYDTERRAWPWVVSLNFGMPINGIPGIRSGHICGGTLLHSQWVLTAAHCLDIPGKPNTFPKSPPKQWRVTAGMHTRSTDEQKKGNWQTSTVKRFIYHKDFRDYTVSAVNDIALIQLAQPFKYTDYVRPICLPDKRKIKPGWNRCYTAGWGTKSENATKYALSLQEVPIPVVNQWFCRARYPDKYVQGQHICGGDWYRGNMDSCKGDSGGPLACQLENGSWYVAGIVSWGIGCGRKKTPGVYTNVQAYENWVFQVVRKFTVTSKTSKPKAYISKHTRRRKRETVTQLQLNEDWIESSTPLSTLERKTFWNSLRRNKRFARSVTDQKQSFLKMLTRSKTELSYSNQLISL